MANTVNLHAIGDALTAWLSGQSVRLYLCDADYTFAAGHNADDIPAGAIIGDPATLANVTVAATGAIDADDPTVTGVASAETITQGVFVRWTGTASTSRVLARLDRTPADAGISLATDGNNVAVTLPTGGFLTAA